MYQDDVHIKRVRRKPPTWILSKYEDGDDGPQKVTAGLVKGKQGGWWQLMYGKGQARAFKTKRRALNWFNKYCKPDEPAHIPTPL